MEIKILISDSAGGGGTTPAPSIQVGGEPSRAGTGGGESSATTGQQMSPPAEIAQAAAAVGAINAGPAPGTGGSTQFGVPPPFVSSTGVSDMETTMPSAGTSAGQSTAVQGGVSPMETEAPTEGTTGE